MRQILNNLAAGLFKDPGGVIGNVTLLVLGVLIITGGRIGIQIAPEYEVRWIEVFADMDSWIGWVLIWFSVDDMLFKGKATIFLLSKTIVPVVETVLKAILGEDKFSRLIKRFQKETGETEEVESQPPSAKADGLSLPH